jgi:glucoamylase
LWEEVKGSSFFTTAVQHRALVEGYDFTAKLNGGKGDPVLKNAAGQVLCFLQTYWKQDDKGGFIVSNLNQQWDAERSGLDANS